MTAWITSWHCYKCEGTDTTSTDDGHMFLWTCVASDEELVPAWGIDDGLILIVRSGLSRLFKLEPYYVRWATPYFRVRCKVPTEYITPPVGNYAYYTFNCDLNYNLEVVEVIEIK